MPGLDELEWRDYVDFSGGLWERGNDRECAENGLLECTDCFPQPWGGLRAFAEFRPIRALFPATTPQNGYVLGIWAAKTDISPMRGLYVLVISGSSAPFTLVAYHLVQGGDVWPSEAALEGGLWQAVLTQTTTNIGTGIRAEFTRAASLGFRVNLPVDTTNMGIWNLTSSTSSLAIPIGSQLSRPMGFTVYQDRMMWIGSYVQTDSLQSVVYTDPASTAISTANVFTPDGSSPNFLRFLAPFSPSDLLTVKAAHSLVDIQGPITAPTSRQLGWTHVYPRGFPVQTDIGLIFVETNEGAYLWDGANLSHLSPSIRGDGMGGSSQVSVTSADQADLTYYADFDGSPPWGYITSYQQTGQLGAFEHFVFFNRGYMLDTRTKAWFKQSSAPAGRYWASDYLGRRVYVSTSAKFSGPATGAGNIVPDALFYSPMGESSWTPMHTYSFTLPLITSPSQKTNLREIEYDLVTYNDSSTVEIEVTTPAGTDIYGPFALANTQADTARVIIKGHPREWHKVRTILKSNRHGTEAPTLRALRTGTQPSTRSPVNT